MRKRHHFFFVFVLIFYFSCSGCTDSGLKDAKTDLKAAEEKIGVLESSLKEADEELESVKAENMRLTEEMGKLQEDVNTLERKNTILSGTCERLDAWSKKLADGYGPGIWYMDESTLPVFVKSMKSSDVNGIVQELNERFSRDHLPDVILKKVDDNTAYLGIDDDDLLTRRMGSHGARSYINAVTYSITSVKGIDCIWLDFEEGDHAAPGEYCR